MADYAIGDVQGCFQPLMKLLDCINFDDGRDRLWFVGDLVNRGPDSLAVMRFVSQLKTTPIITLGNHDLHYLALAYGVMVKPNKASVSQSIRQSIKPELEQDSLDELLAANDGELLREWLRQQKLIHYDADLKIVMVHAGIAPCWNLSQALVYAREVEETLQGDDYLMLLQSMYGNKPCTWHDSLTGLERSRLIINYFTRMRFCRQDGSLNLSYKGTLEQAPSDLIPWFKVVGRHRVDADMVFGHWAALQGQADVDGVYAIDTGCLWGGKLTALRLQDRTLFQI